MRRAITAQRQRELADLNVTVEEGLSISGIQLSKTMGTGAGADRPVHRVLGPADRPGAALASWPAAGGWPSMSVIFAAIPAVIYLGAGPADDRRHA